MIDTLVALTPANSFSVAWQFLQKGGFFMFPLGIACVAGMMAMLFKALTLARKRVIPADLENQVIQFEWDQNPERSRALLQELEKGESSLARLCAVAVKHRGKAEDHIKRVVESAAREEVVHLHAGIGMLDVVITVAPLLGLLGTASGLVEIFRGLGDTTDHLAIARGISEALHTTIFGLAIAVPCVIAQSYFSRRIETFTARLESLLTDFAHLCRRQTVKNVTSKP